MTKKICVLNPYIPTLGGGEKHMGLLCTFMEEYYGDVEIDILVHNFNNINIYADDYVTIDKLNKRFDISLSKTKIKKIDVISSNKLIDKIKNKFKIEKETKKYDLFVNFMFFSKHIGRAKKNLYVCMFPAYRFEDKVSGFKKKLLAKIADRLYIKSYDVFTPISEYTNYWFHTFWGNDNNSKIIFPPVISEQEIDKLYNEKDKKNIIISVGRFFVSAHCKRQLEMVKMFVSNNEAFKGYEYHLVGAVANTKEDLEYLNQVKQLAKQVDNVFIHENCPYNELVDLYKSAKIFWHAAGYTINENIEPEKVEHFGISTVEAMCYGAVPVVINKGGLKETVEHTVSGYVWNTEEECVKYTCELINNDDKRKIMAEKAQERSKKFSIEQYFRANKELFDEYKL